MNDCLLCIFNYLPLKDITHCLVICKHYRKVAKKITNNELFWKLLLEKDFKEKSPENNYKEVYKRIYSLSYFLLRTHNKNTQMPMPMRIASV